MESLHEASLYLLEHWDTYIEMQQVTSEINIDYLLPLLEIIKENLTKHPDFPKDWSADTDTNLDDESGIIFALPNVWEKWNVKNDNLGCVLFGNLELSELLATEREDRSWFCLEISLGSRMDELSKKSANKLWEVSKNYVSQLEGFEWKEEYKKETCFYKHIDKMPVSTLKDKKQLISFVVDGMISMIRVVDQIKKDHFYKKPKN